MKYDIAGNLTTLSNWYGYSKPPIHGSRLKNGIDSYVGAIAVDKSDTLYFDLGMYSNNLTEPNIEIITRQMMEESATNSIKDIIVKDIPLDVDLDPDRFRKQNVSWDTIDNRHAKIVFPRISGNGLTGVYIDSLWQRGSSKI